MTDASARRHQGKMRCQRAHHEGRVTRRGDRMKHTQEAYRCTRHAKKKRDPFHTAC